MMCRNLLDLRMVGKSEVWLDDFLKDRNQVVAANRFTSEGKQIMRSVPQGPILDPLLFRYTISCPDILLAALLLAMQVMHMSLREYRTLDMLYIYSESWTQYKCYSENPDTSCEKWTSQNHITSFV